MTQERCSKFKKKKSFKLHFYFFNRYKKLNLSKLNSIFSPTFSLFQFNYIAKFDLKRFDYIRIIIKLIQHIFTFIFTNQIYPFDRILILMIFNYSYYSIPSTYFINNLTIKISFFFTFIKLFLEL